MAKDSLKRQHERAAGERLVAWLILQCGVTYDVRGQPQPPAPDLIIGDQSGTIGVEVVTAYYGNEDATLRWAWARGSESRSGMGGIDLDSQLKDFVQSVLDAKCAKTYAFNGPVWFLIDACPALTTEGDIEDLCEPDPCTEQNVVRRDLPSR